MRVEHRANRTVELSRGLTSALALFLILAVSACRHIPDLDGSRGEAIGRTLDEALVNALECRKDDCEDWHRLRLEERGTLYLNVRAVHSETPDSHFAVRLEDGFGAIIEGLDKVGNVRQGIERDLDPGAYLIGIIAPERSKTILYELSFRFEPFSLPPDPEQPIEEAIIAPPEPTYRAVPAEVLEVEGKLAEPSGVLLDLGGQRGVYSGMRGELREGDSVIGEIEVIDIYDEGSRARVDLPLQRPITPSVSAVLFFPIVDESDIGSDVDDDTDDDESPSNVWSTEPDAFQPDPD